jgi:hypothetical protein
MAEPKHKRCCGCNYIRDGLPELRCPECGRSFDPNDPMTYRGHVEPRRADWAIVLAIGAWIAMLVPALFIPLLGLDSVITVLALVGSVGWCVNLFILVRSLAVLLKPGYAARDRAGWLAAFVIALLGVVGCCSAVAWFASQPVRP